MLNHCLAHLPDDQRLAIIVNDLGKVAVDGQLIERAGYAMKELPSGCVCCTLAGALVESLIALVQDQQPDVIVMETTGIAEPAQIAILLRGGALRDVVCIGNVVCVLDSSTFTKFEEHFRIMQLQVEQANTIVMNKTDLADAEVFEAAQSRAAYLAQPDACMLRAKHGNVDPEILYAVRPVYFPARPALDEHAHEFQACTIVGSECYQLEALTATLSDLGAEVLRFKGIVRTDGGPKLIQGTPAGLEIADWAEDVDESKLVFIARNLPSDEIRASLRDCL